MTGTNSFAAEDFDGLAKINTSAFGGFCRARKLKVDPAHGIDPDQPVAGALAALYLAHDMPTFFRVLAYALPVRESVWLACLAGEQMLPEGAEPTAALKAAQAWVYKPNEDTRKAVELAIKDADFDDPTVLAADAAFHGMAKGLEDVVHSPPTACPTMVFAMLLKAALRDGDAAKAETNWQDLVGFSLNIAAGGTGKNDG